MAVRGTLPLAPHSTNSLSLTPPATAPTHKLCGVLFSPSSSCYCFPSCRSFLTTAAAAADAAAGAAATAAVAVATAATELITEPLFRSEAQHKRPTLVMKLWRLRSEIPARLASPRYSRALRSRSCTWRVCMSGVRRTTGTCDDIRAGLVNDAAGRQRQQHRRRR